MNFGQALIELKKLLVIYKHAAVGPHIAYAHASHCKPKYVEANPLNPIFVLKNLKPPLRI